MTTYLLKVFWVVVWSALKYIVGFITALSVGFSFPETLFYNVGGGMLGVIFYLYLWEFLKKIKRRLFPRKPRHGIRISNFRRWLVKFIRKYEIYGIIVLTPILLTPPVGTLLAAAIEHN